MSITEDNTASIEPSNEHSIENSTVDMMTASAPNMDDYTVDDGVTSTMIGFWGIKRKPEWTRTFSNFYPCEITLDGNLYSCSEQVYMHEKAVFFHDDDTATKLLEPGLSPGKYKRLGRLVQGYDDDKWAQVRYDAMLTAVGAKYRQNPTLRSILIATGDRTLVECSPFDTVWGIGLGTHDESGNSDDRWTHPEQWRGENLLGRALMETRVAVLGQ